MKKRPYIQVILSVLLTIILVAPILYFFMQNASAVISLQKSLFNNFARVDVLPSGNKSVKVEIVDSNTGVSVQYPDWAHTQDSQGAVLTLPITDEWQINNFKIRVGGNGQLNLLLRGPWQLVVENSAEKQIYKILVDYRFVLVNNQQILDGRQAFWHNAPYKYSMQVKDGDEIAVQLQIRRHHLQKQDISAIWEQSSVDWMILFSLLVIIYLLTRKLVAYLADFKLQKQQSRIDVVFVCIFMILLFVPMMHISTAQKSLQENRMLAPWPQLLTNRHFNLQFGKQFDAWYNDHFYGRDELMKLYTHLKLLNKIYQNDSALYFQNSGWMFNKPYIPYLPTDTAVEDVISAIKKFDAFCKKNNAILYVLIVPKKEHIYSGQLAGYGYNHQKASEFNQYIQKLRNILPDQRVLYPEKELKTGAQKDYVFFKQAHHWTDWGAFLGYQMLAERIKQDFVDFNIVELNDYNVSYSNKIRDDWDRNYNTGHTTRLLNLNNLDTSKILTTTYKYYDYKKADNITEKRGKYIKEFFNKGAQNDYKLFLTGNSQNEDMLQFLTASVENVKYLRLNMGNLPKSEQFKFMKHHKKELLNFKPDIVVITISSNIFYILQDLYKD